MRVAFLSLLGAMACSVPSDIREGQACPCLDGWVCEADVCVRGGGERDLGVDLGLVDAGLRDAGRDEDLGLDAGADDLGMPDAGPDLGPVLHLDCESISATSVPDVSGNDNDAVCVAGNCPTLAPDGAIGSACQFAGDRALEVAAPFGSSLTPDAGTSFSLALWFRLDAIRFGSLYSRALGMETANTFEFYVTTPMTDPPQGRPTFWRATTDGGDYWTAPLVSVDEWHHMAAVADAENGETVVYFDGAVLMTMPGVVFLYDDHPILIGGDENRGMRNNYSRAHIDEVLFYDRAIGPDEVARLATRP